MAKHTILCIDDEIYNVDALERLFRKKYEVLKATSGVDALKILDQHPGKISVIITDQRMPEMTGVELLEKTISSHPDAIRILLTGYTDIESVIDAVNKGQIFRYLTKPWDPIDLSNTVDHAIDRYHVGQELKNKNIELEKALDELRSLDKAKNHFMLLINHELKTPLTSIISFLSLLNETEMSEDQILYTEKITEASTRLKGLIDDVLLLMRAETQQLVINKKMTQIGSVLVDLKIETKEILLQKQQVIKESFEDTPCHVDSRLLGFALDRLVNNAAKFGNEKSEILVSGKKHKEKFRISVNNFGKPIPEPVITQIFKPFFIDENAMNHRKGLGLGLSIAQAVIKCHDSVLQIENRDDGVTVFFDL